MAPSDDAARSFYVMEGMKRLGEGIHPWISVQPHFHGCRLRKIESRAPLPC